MEGKEVKFTKGEFEVRGLKIFKKGTSYSIGQAFVISNFDIVHFKSIEDVEAITNAGIICEAFNVANQTGLTPSQLQLELEKAKELLKELIPLAEDGYKLHVRNASHQEFLKEDRELISSVTTFLEGSGNKTK